MEKVRLGDVCKVQGGYAFKSNEFMVNNVPVIRIGNIQDKKVNIDTNICYKEEFLIQHPEFKVEYGDVLIAMSGATVGKVGKYLENNNALLNQRVGKFINSEKIDKDYLYFLLQSPLFEKFILNNAFGCAQPNISNKKIEEFSFYNYSIKEQNEITSKLNKIQEIIDIRKKQIDDLNELIKSQFVEMFGNPNAVKNNEKIDLKSIMINANNGMARRGNNSDGNIVLRLVELQRNYIDYSNVNKISLKDNEKKKYLLSEGDILFARVNGNPDNVGRCAYFKDIGEDVYHNDHIIRVKFDLQKINPIYLCVLLNDEYGKGEFKNKIKTSAGQYTISQDGIEKVKILLPQIELQNQFAEIVKQIDKQKFEIEKSLKEIKKLQESLMNKYFGG